MLVAMLWMVRNAAVVVQPRASSSTIRLASRRLSASPPAASGVYMPMKPSSPAAARASLGKIDCASQRAAFGASTPSENARALSTKACCSSVREKSMAASAD
jgi:hypothetical protein